MSIFRRATPSDTVFIMRLLREFYREKGAIYAGIPFDEGTTAAMIDHVILHGIALVGPTSCAGAFVLPFTFNARAIQAHVLYWYFREAREIAIFDEMLKICRDLKITHLCAAAPLNTAVGRYYRKKGLMVSETQYIIDLQKGLQPTPEQVDNGSVMEPDQIGGPS